MITKARAFDNTLHLVAANRVGDDGKALSFFGHSKIVDPVGREIAALDAREEGVISAEIDLSLTQKERARYYTCLLYTSCCAFGRYWRGTFSAPDSG